MLFGVVLCLPRTAVGPSKGDLLALYGQLAYPKWGQGVIGTRKHICVDMQLVQLLTLSGVVL